MQNLSIRQLAAMNMHYARYSLDYFFDSIARLGFDRFELWGGAPHFFYPTDAGPSVAEIKKELVRRDLEVVCVTPEQCVYPYNIASSQKDFRQVSAEYFCGWIRRTAELGVSKMLCGPGWGLHDVPYEESWKYSVQSLERMTREAERCGVTLAFEILLPNESNLVCNMASAKRIMAEIDSPNFGLCIDTVPMFNEGKSLEDYYEALGDRIVHIHLNDGKPTGHLTWGDGEQPLQEHLDTLARHRYTGDIALELGANRYYADPEPPLLRGLRVLEKAFGQTLK